MSNDFVMKAVTVIILLFAVKLAGAQKNYEVRVVSRQEARDYQNGNKTEDTSFVYKLPYSEGQSYKVIQGYYSSFLGSHHHSIAIDFKMKVGTNVCAARGGVVQRVIQNRNGHGLGKKYKDSANYIRIDHLDGTFAVYWHLKKGGAKVKEKDTVKTGQVIALSGFTGKAVTPHLHFLVYQFDCKKYWYPIPTRFLTETGPGYLLPTKRYKSIISPK